MLAKTYPEVILSALKLTININYHTDIEYCMKTSRKTNLGFCWDWNSEGSQKQTISKQVFIHKRYLRKGGITKETFMQNKQDMDGQEQAVENHMEKRL